MVRFDNLQPFVHHRCGVDRDLSTHFQFGWLGLQCSRVALLQRPFAKQSP
jgi:hypothetical protein